MNQIQQPYEFLTGDTAPFSNQTLNTPTPSYSNYRTFLLPWFRISIFLLLLLLLGTKGQLYYTYMLFDINFLFSHSVCKLSFCYSPWKFTTLQSNEHISRLQKGLFDLKYYVTCEVVYVFISQLTFVWAFVRIVFHDKPWCCSWSVNQNWCSLAMGFEFYEPLPFQRFGMTLDVADRPRRHAKQSVSG